MKNIIINGRFLGRRVTGVERYAREIVAELDKILQPSEMELAVPPEVMNIPEYKNIKVVQIGRLHNRLWEHISFPLYVKRKKGISLNLCNVAPLISPGIVCIHDVKIKATPQYFSKKFVLWYQILFNNAVRRTKAVITVSDFSKKEICKYYHVNSEKISVIPNAWQHYKRIGYDEDTLKKYGLEQRQYIFSMSSLEPNKNFRWIAEIAERNKGERFVISGAINKRVFAEGFGFKCPNNIKLLGYISDEEAKTLMRDCKAFLFPTFYEGFGLPPLEAMSNGAECIVVSDTEIMHEIYEDAACYVDPLEYDIDLKNLIQKKSLSEKEKILGKFSWEKSAEALKELCESV